METEAGEETEEGEKEEKDKEEKKASEEKPETSLEDNLKKHGFLILSREDSTMVQYISISLVSELCLRAFKNLI